MIASKDELMKAFEKCAGGCDDDGCIYLKEQNSRGGLAVVRCVDLMAQDALELLKEQQTEIERMKRDGKTCANCSRCKTRMANGTGCYYPRCKKHNMWVRSGFYCSDWQKEGDENAD